MHVPQTPVTPFGFKRVWQASIPGSKLQNIFSLKGEDGVEYALLCDNNGSVACLNDLGEEVWRERLVKGTITDISASSNADLAVITTENGIACFDLSGCELIKLFGNYAGVHVFDSASLILLDSDGIAHFYQSYDCTSVKLDISDKVFSIEKCGDFAALKAENTVFLIDCEGKSKASKVFDSKIVTVSQLAESEHIFLSCEDGLLNVLDNNLEVLFSYKFKVPALSLTYNNENETFFFGLQDSTVAILQRRTGHLYKTELIGTPKSVVSHNHGAVFGTDMDQIALLTTSGQGLAKFTFPSHLLALFPCRRQQCLLALFEDSISCLALLPESKS